MTARATKSSTTKTKTTKKAPTTPKSTTTVAKVMEKKTPSVKEVQVLPTIEQAKSIVEETEFYPNKISMQFAYPEENKKEFLWQEFSPRCGAITGPDNFQTVHYFAFPDEESGVAFITALTETFCKDAVIRSSKRFNPTKYPFEVKVWGMTEKIFFILVKRDLDRDLNAQEKEQNSTNK